MFMQADGRRGFRENCAIFVRVLAHACRGVLAPGLVRGLCTCACVLCVVRGWRCIHITVKVLVPLCAGRMPEFVSVLAHACRGDLAPGRVALSVYVCVCRVSCVVWLGMYTYDDNNVWIQILRSVWTTDGC